MSEEILSNLSESLKARAHRARASAWLSAVFIVCTVFGVVALFFSDLGAIVPLNQYGDLPVPLLGMKKEIPDEDKPIDEPLSEPPEVVLKKLEVKKQKIEVALKAQEIREMAKESNQLSRSITDSIAKIGAVLISLFLVQILLGVMRYHFKLADHLEAVSEALKISNNDVEKLEKIVSVIGVSHIDFGKNPQTPVDKIAEIAKELADKVATLKTSTSK